MEPNPKVGESRRIKRQKTGGRKKGTPNATTRAVRSAIEAADPISFMIDVMRGEIPNGNGLGDCDTKINVDIPSPAERLRAAEFLARRVIPEAKEQSLSFDIGVIDTPSGALRAMSDIASGLANGAILPSGAKALNDALNGYLRAFETAELSERLDAIETTLASR